MAIVDELEKRGFLRRTVVPGDRRIQALVPTAAGISASKETLKAAQAHEAALLSGLSETERQSLIGLLKKVRACGQDAT